MASSTVNADVIQKIRKLIDFFEPFRQCDEETKTLLAQKGELVRGTIGQTLLRADGKVTHIYLIVEGKVRIVGRDSRTDEIETVELSRPGQTLGWVSVLRGKSCETALCSSPVIAVRFERDLVTQLFAKSREARIYWGGQAPQAELFEATAEFLKQHPSCRLSTLEIVKRCSLSYKVCIATPSNVDSLCSDGMLWYVSGGSAHATVTTNLKPLFAQTKAFRVIGINQSILRKSLSSDELGEDTSNPDLLLFDEIRDLDEKEIEIVKEDFEPEYVESEDELKIIYRRGRGPIEGSAACLRMVCETMGIPLKREMVLRILRDQTERFGGITLPLAGAICETLGLRTQITAIIPQTLHKFEFPLLILQDTELVLISRSTDQVCEIIVPSKGIAEIPLDQLVAQEDGRLEVLLLVKTDQTPEDNFSLKWFLPSLGRYKVVLTEVLLSSLFVQLFGLANPLLIQQIIDKVIIGSAPSALGSLGSLLILFALLEVILQSLRTFLFVDTTNRIDIALGSQVIDHMLKLPLKFFDKRPVGELSSRISELENIRKFLTGTALTAVIDAVFSLIYVFVMLVYSWQLTLVTLAVIPALIGLTYYFSPIVRKQIQSKSVAAAKTQSHLVEVLSGMQTVKSQGIELRTRWKWQDLYVDYVADGFNNTLVSTASGGLSNFVNKTSSLMVVWMGAALVTNGQLTLGGMIAFRMIAGYVTGPVLRLSQIWQSFQEISLSIERLGDILNHPQEAGPDELKKPSVSSLNGEIEYQDIWFRYNPSGEYLLKGINLHIPPGSFVAFVGLSGSGKSTATKLLPRLYEPEKGKVLVDGMDIAKLELYSLRKQIGIVPQDTLLFDGSILDNITLTNPTATQDEIDEAVEISCSKEFIESLPAKYDTKVGERGSNLSGGQRQRLAIARTILQKPSVLLMDEATSALDYQTERKVSENLMVKLKGRTVLYVTHRLSSIVNADMIVLMGAGEILEVGTHNELIKRKSSYFSLFNQQGTSMSS